MLSTGKYTVKVYTLNMNNLEFKPIVFSPNKIEYEFQLLCTEIEEYFGKHKIIWSLPYRKGVTDSLLRDTLLECKKREKPFIKYFLKVIYVKSKKNLH